MRFSVAGRPQCPLHPPTPTPASCRKDGYCDTALWTLSVRNTHEIKACVRCMHILDRIGVDLTVKRYRKIETDAPTLASCLVRKSMKPKPRWAPPIPFFGRRTVFSSPNVLNKNTLIQHHIVYLHFKTLISHDWPFYINYQGTMSKTILLS